jgi:hypothetical protein
MIDSLALDYGADPDAPIWQAVCGSCYKTGSLHEAADGLLCSDCIFQKQRISIRIGLLGHREIEAMVCGDLAYHPVPSGTVLAQRWPDAWVISRVSTGDAVTCSPLPANEKTARATVVYLINHPGEHTDRLIERFATTFGEWLQLMPQNQGKLAFYTVLLDRDGFPVKYMRPEEYRLQTLHGPHNDPGEASAELKALLPGAQYLDPVHFERKRQALAQLRREKTRSTNQSVSDEKPSA